MEIVEASNKRGIISRLRDKIGHMHHATNTTQSPTVSALEEISNKRGINSRMRDMRMRVNDSTTQRTTLSASKSDFNDSWMIGWG